MLYTLFVPHSELINLIINDGNRTECRRGSRIWKWGVRNQILFQYLRDKKKKKEGGSEKGGVKIHPFHLPWIRAWGGVQFCL